MCHDGCPSKMPIYRLGTLIITKLSKEKYISLTIGGRLSLTA
jgi:hypothetical protein